MAKVMFNARWATKGQYEVELSDEDTEKLRNLETESEVFAYLAPMIDDGRAKIRHEDTDQYVTLKINGQEHIV